MDTNEVLKIMEETGAVLKGHFLLSSGLHSDTYFQMARLFQYPAAGERLSRELAERFRADRVDAVIGPAVGGILISYELARQLGARSVFAERENGVLRLRRGFSIGEEERVLACEDVITTGGSVREVLDIVRERKADILGIACIVERGKADLPCRVESLLKVEVNNYAPAECPLCLLGTPAVKPGSRSL